MYGTQTSSYDCADDAEFLQHKKMLGKGKASGSLEEVLA